MGSRCAAPALHLQPLLYMCSLCCTSAAPAVHVQPQPSRASHSQPCTATARQLPNLTKTVQKGRFFTFWLDTCSWSLIGNMPGSWLDTCFWSLVGHMPGALLHICLEPGWTHASRTSNSKPSQAMQPLPSPQKPGLWPGFWGQKI